MEKKLYKSNKDKKIAGVCGGLAEYLNIDATIIRLLWVLLCFVAAGILAYIIAAIVIPEQPAEEQSPVDATVEEKEATAVIDDNKPESL